MLIAAGGGGAGGTDWGLMTVEQMQALIQNPDTEKHYELLTGWKRSADLLLEHRWQVQNYRDNLAAAWPPEKNAASAAYLARLDELIANLTETYEAAISNHDAFAAATLSLSLAQKDMEKITQEYAANKQLLLDYSAAQQATSGQPQPSPSPSGEQPPVAPGRQEELHQKAVTLLSGVSADLAQAQVRIQKPTLYRHVLTDDVSQANDGQQYTAPPIPPVTPSFEGNGAGGLRTPRPSATFPTNSPPPAGTTPPVTAAPQPGLVLGGISPTPSPPLAPPGGPLQPPTTPPTGTPSLITNPGVVPPNVGILPPGGGPTAIPSRGTGAPREAPIRAGTQAPGSLHVMPPGGLIGATPAAGLGQPGSTRSAPSRVNPIGGVIGHNMPSGNAGTRSIAGAQQTGSSTAPYGQPGSRRSDRDSEANSTRWDPDNPWQTAEGVSPVVMPAREQRVDPGPAIGL
ncbi:hypothetical protein [Actinoplanes sp. URMC 104]|uniref:hypothetical protein n=1 Tax=Actinoplanes sp. URMC 104 TaxID=3423409 RepID=UPI003F19B43D